MHIWIYLHFPADWLGSLSGRGGARRGDLGGCIRGERGECIRWGLPGDVPAGGM